jgi:hypothetical protein
MSALREYCNTEVRNKKKGRSEKRLYSRDLKIVARFYYHAKIREMNFAKVIDALSIEFDLDESVINFRLRFRQNELDAIFEESPQPHVLQIRYPYYAW